MALVPVTSIHRVEADGVEVFYREAGSPDAPVVLLLHGFPASSFQYRELIPRLADQYRAIAPDLPGFGFTIVPDERTLYIHLRRAGADHSGLYQRAPSDALCIVRLRLWRTDRLSSGDGSSGTCERYRFAERKRV